MSAGLYNTYRLLQAAPDVADDKYFDWTILFDEIQLLSLRPLAYNLVMHTPSIACTPSLDRLV